MELDNNKKKKKKKAGRHCMHAIDPPYLKNHPFCSIRFTITAQEFMLGAWPWCVPAYMHLALRLHCMHACTRARGANSFSSAAWPCYAYVAAGVPMHAM